MRLQTPPRLIADLAIVAVSTLVCLVASCLNFPIRALHHSAHAQSAAPSDTDQEMSRVPANSAVRFLFPEQISVEAGKQSVVDLHFRVAAGLHINSHKPRSKTLIPTNLIVVEQPGIKVASVDFPPGSDYAFSFAPDEKLSIYSDALVLRAHLTAERGDHLLQGALRYQACDSNSCYPPKTIPVAIDVIGK